MNITVENGISGRVQIESRRHLEGNVTQFLYTLGKCLSEDGEGGLTEESPVSPGTIRQRIASGLGPLLYAPIASDGTLMQSEIADKKSLVLYGGNNEPVTYASVLGYIAKKLQTVGQRVDIAVVRDHERETKVLLKFDQGAKTYPQVGLRLKVTDETVAQENGEALILKGTYARVQKISLVPYIATREGHSNMVYLPDIIFEMEAIGYLIKDAVAAMQGVDTVSSFINTVGEHCAFLRTYRDRIGYPPGWIAENSMFVPILDEYSLRNHDYHILMNGVSALVGFVEMQNR